MASLEYIQTVVRGIARADLKMAYENGVRVLRGTEIGDVQITVVFPGESQEKTGYMLHELNKPEELIATGEFKHMMHYLTHNVYTIELEEAHS